MRWPFALPSARRFARVLGLVVACAVLTCCSRFRSSEPPTAERIVSLSPSTTEAVFALGAGASLVGRSRYCDYPAEVARLPEVGGYVDPSLEAILALRPTLVVGARGPSGSALAEKLAARGIGTYFPATESFATINAMILGLGERTHRVTKARIVVDALGERIAAVERAVSPQPRTRALLVFGLDPLSVAGPGSFPDEMLRRAGAANVVTEGTTYPTLNVERVLALDPDVILDASMMDGHAAARMTAETPGWSRVRAVKTGRVVALPYEAVLRPGPRIAEGLAHMARALHPDATRAIDAAFDGGRP